jgi:2-oxoglutarate dehydrogenase E2 component (dihydrolipoamide succinyltransferase)
MKQIVVPQLGESVTEATVSKWLKKEGESVKADEPIVELETDKVTLEVNAPSDGVIVKISAGEGQTVEVGALLGEFESGAVANDVKKPAPAAAAPAPAAPAPKPQPVATAPAPAKTSAHDDDAGLSPAVRKMLGDNNIEASKIKGSGPGGRISKEDVQKYIAQRRKPRHLAKLPHGKSA